MNKNRKTLNQMKNKFYGEEGTGSREEFEKDLEAEITNQKLQEAGPDGEYFKTETDETFEDGDIYEAPLPESKPEGISKHSMGDEVVLDFGIAGKLTNATVAGVKYTDYGKVYYDVSVQFAQLEITENDIETTILHDVDSYFVKAVEKPDYSSTDKVVYIIEVIVAGHEIIVPCEEGTTIGEIKSAALQSTQKVEFNDWEVRDSEGNELDLGEPYRYEIGLLYINRPVGAGA